MAKTAFNGIFKLGSAGTETTLVTTVSDKCEKLDFSRMQELIDASRFNQSGAKEYVIGLSDAEFDVDIQFDNTVNTHLNALIGNATAVSFEFGPDGSTTGYPKYTGSMLLSDLGRPSQVGQKKMINAKFKVTGAITSTTY